MPGPPKSSLPAASHYHRDVLGVRAQGGPPNALQGTYDAAAGLVLALGQPQQVLVYQHQVAGHVHHHLHQLEGQVGESLRQEWGLGHRGWSMRGLSKR